MTKTEYGENYQEHLIEQYKLYVEMADNISQRRSQANAFYTSVLSVLLVIVSFVADKNEFSDRFAWILLAFALLGFFLCVIWFLNIRSYRQLNSGKFTVILDMEEQLPYPCYKREWDFLKKGRSKRFYWPLTHIEQYIPFVLSIPYLLLFLYALSLLKSS